MDKIRDFCKDNNSIIITAAWALTASFIGNIYVLFAVEIFSLLFLLVCGSKLNYDIGDVLLGLGMFFFYYFDGKTLAMAIVLSIEVLIIYQIGKVINKKNTVNKFCSPVKSIYCIAGIFFIAAAIDYYKVIVHPELRDYQWDFLWHNTIVPRTQHEFWFILAVSLAPCFIIFKQINNKIRVFGIIAGLIGLGCSLFMRGRIAFCVFALVLLVCLGIQLFENVKKIKIHKIISLIITLLIIVILVIYLFDNNYFGLRARYENSLFSDEGGMIHNVRVEMWKAGMELIKRYPLGGNHIEVVTGHWWKFHYAHNSWIDIGVCSGIIPFVLIVLYSVYITLLLIHMIMKEESYEKYILLSAYMGIFLYNMVEPAIIANRVFWFTLIYLSGIIAGFRDTNNKV